MSQFEFETKEQREAFGITDKLFQNACGPGYQYRSDVWDEMKLAASRFDEREKTCGIEFGSYAYGLLVIAQHVGLNQFNLRMPTLDRFLTKEHGLLNDEGRELLAQVNAMCKVER